MSEFSTIISDGSVLFVGSQVCVKRHSIYHIIIAPKGIMEDVELFLDELIKIKKPINLVERIQKYAKEEEIGPFTLIRKKMILTIGEQEAMIVPKLDYLTKHRLKSVLGLNPKIWSLDVENFKLIPFQL